MNNSALFKIGYGLYVLTARDGVKDNGCIINTVMQITNSAPTFAVISVNKQNYTHDMIMNTREFNTSVLSTRTPFEIFERFGFKTGKNCDKFDGFGNTARSKNGILYLTDFANAFLSFKVTDTVDFGSHTMFKSEISDGDVISEDESVTYSYYQKHIKPKPQSVQKKGYRCLICGYVHESDNLPNDFICPLCKHGANDFEKIS